MILNIRPSPLGEQLALLLQQRGLSASHTPLIRIQPEQSNYVATTMIDSLPAGSIVIALSQHVMNALNTNIDYRVDLTFMAIGKRTAQLLQCIVKQLVYFPLTGETSEQLLTSPLLQSIRNKHILLLKGADGRELLANTLIQRGAIVQPCRCYQRQLIDYDGQVLLSEWKKVKICRIIVTSNTLLTRLYDIIPDKTWLLSRPLIVVSQRIARHAKQLGWQDIIVTHSANNKIIANSIYSIVD